MDKRFYSKASTAPMSKEASMVHAKKMEIIRREWIKRGDSYRPPYPVTEAEMRQRAIAELVADGKFGLIEDSRKEASTMDPMRFATIFMLFLTPFIAGVLVGVSIS